MKTNVGKSWNYVAKSNVELHAAGQKTRKCWEVDFEPDKRIRTSNLHVDYIYSHLTHVCISVCVCVCVWVSVCAWGGACVKFTLAVFQKKNCSIWVLSYFMWGILSWLSRIIQNARSSIQNFSFRNKYRVKSRWSGKAQIWHNYGVFLSLNIFIKHNIKY
jgi:hypothetical protein